MGETLACWDRLIRVMTYLIILKLALGRLTNWSLTLLYGLQLFTIFLNKPVLLSLRWIVD